MYITPHRDSLSYYIYCSWNRIKNNSYRIWSEKYITWVRCTRHLFAIKNNRNSITYYTIGKDIWILYYIQVYLCIIFLLFSHSSFWSRRLEGFYCAESVWNEFSFEHYTIVRVRKNNHNNNNNNIMVIVIKIKWRKSNLYDDRR